MSKKKKRQFSTSSKTVQISKKRFVLNKKKLLEFSLIFISVFVFVTIIALQRKPINTHQAYGDNYYYHKNAKALSLIWHKPFKYSIGLLTHSLSERETSDIGFNYYSGFDSVLRAPSYIFSQSFWLFIFGDKEISNLLSQTFILTLVILLIYYILSSAASREYAMVGIGLTILYIPFHTSATITMTELWQALNFLLLYIIANKIFLSRQITIKKSFLLSFVLLSTVLSKSSFKYFYLFFVILFISFMFIYFDKKKIVNSTIKFLIGFFVIFILWGQISTINKPATVNVNTYGGGVFWNGSIAKTEGHIPAYGVHTKEFRNNINKGTEKFWFTRYLQVANFATIQLIKNHPISYTSMVIKKIDSLLLNPPWYNHLNLHLQKFKQIYLRPYHIILLLLTLIAMFYLPTKFYFLKYFFFIILSYFFGVYGLAGATTRFFQPLVAFYIIFAVLLVYYIINSKDYVYFMKNAIFTTIFYLLFRKNVLVYILPNLYLISAFQFIGFNLLLTYLLLIVPKSHLHQSTNLSPINFYLKQKETPVYIILFLFLFLSSVTSYFDNLQLNHFAYKLKPNGIVKETIILDNEQLNKLKTDSEKIYIALDIRHASKKDTLKIQINSFTSTNIPLTNALTTINSNVTFPNYIINKWIFFPIKISKLQKTNIIKIKQSNAKLFFHLKSKITVPSLLNWFDIDIVEGYNTPIDGRIMTSPQIFSQRKSLINNKFSKNKNFNIFIIRKETGHYYLPKKYEKLMDANIKYLALINPLDRKLVFWRKTNPGEDYVVVRGNLYHYLAGELDRFYSGYHFY